MTREEIYASRQLANRVLRYHGWPVLHRQTTGEHANRVLQIYVEVFGMPRAEVLYFCSVHDIGEQFAGDVPFSGKANVAGLRECMDAAERMGHARLGITLPQLTEEEKVRVKICDLLEMWEFGSAEVEMGNACAIPVVQDTMAAARKLADPSWRLVRAVNFWRRKNVRNPKERELPDG